MYHLIASDLDGTLLLPGDKIGDYTQAVLQRLNQAGKHIVLATGRHQTDVEFLLGNPQHPIHLITSNGARISSACGSLSGHLTLASPTVRALIEATRHDPELVINLYGTSQWLISAEFDDLSEFNQNPDFQPILTGADDFPDTGVEKIFFFRQDKDHDALVELQLRLNKLLGEQITSVFSFPWCLEIMANGVSKGSALKRLAEFLGVPVASCLAFGDGMNDVEMLATAGRGVVMGTAHDKVMRALPNAEVIGSCAEESVARYLENLLLA